MIKYLFNFWKFTTITPLGEIHLTPPHKFDILAGKRTISLTTFYKSGKSVSTPVEFVRSDDKLYALTEKVSYKVKRLRNNAKAVIASCTMRGKITGPKIDVQVKIIPQDEGKFVQEKLDVLYQGLIYRILYKIMFWRKKEEVVFLEIT
jgi:hypothetical protein